MKALMSLREAADETPFGPEHLRRCILTPTPTPTMPALKAKKDGKGRYLIRDVDLLDWIERHEDA